MNVLSLVLVNMSVLTLMGPIGAHAETDTHLKMTTQLVEVIIFLSFYPIVSHDLF